MDATTVPTVDTATAQSFAEVQFIAAPDIATLLAGLPGLADDDLAILQIALQDLLARRQAAAETAATATAPEAAADSSQPKRRRGRGWWPDRKKINGHEYYYRRWREGGHTRSQYVGKVLL
jgi:hypothetical protein